VELLYESLFLLVLFKRLVIVINQVAVYPRQFERLYTNHFVLGSAFLAGNFVAFFYFVQFDV